MSHWDCNERTRTCRYRNGSLLWGVVIQRLACKDHQTDRASYCFKWLRFMDARDSSAHQHSNLHEIFWAIYSGNEWQLASRIKQEDLLEQPNHNDLDNPAPLPDSSKTFAMECRCPLCKRSYKKNPKCGLELFNSDNECAICLEKPGKMLALPCGHQFCEEDLKKLGIFKRKKRKKKKRKRDSQNASRQFRRRVGPSVYVAPSEGKRCSFCGHLGHTVRTCDSHAEKCGCNDYKSSVHNDIQSTQVGCSTCMRRGHAAEFCSVIVLV